MFFHKEKGQGMVEYVLILVLVVIVGIVAWQLLGSTIMNFVFNIVANI
ncbi:MAG: pilus assembly protein [Anaerolineales bacterium]